MSFILSPFPLHSTDQPPRVSLVMGRNGNSLLASWTSRRSTSHRAGQTKIPSGDPLLNPCPPISWEISIPLSTPYSCAHFFCGIKKQPSNPHSNPPVSLLSGPPLKLYLRPSMSRYQAIAECFLKKNQDNQARLVQAHGTLLASRNSPLWTSVFSSVKWDHPATYPGSCEDEIRWFTPNTQLTALPGTPCLSYLLKSASSALGLDAMSTFHETFHFMNLRERTR